MTNDFEGLDFGNVISSLTVAEVHVCRGGRVDTPSTSTL